MRKFEYEVSEFPTSTPGENEFEIQLNSMGAQGWELIHVEVGSYRVGCIFKREVKNEAKT